MFSSQTSCLKSVFLTEVLKRINEVQHNHSNEYFAFIDKKGKATFLKLICGFSF